MKRKKKILLFILMFLIMFWIFSVPSFAEDGLFDAEFETELQDLFENLPEEITEIFHEMQIEKIEFGQIINVSPETILHFIFETATFKIFQILKTILHIVVILVFAGTFRTFFSVNETDSVLFDICIPIISAMFLVQPLLECIGNIFSALQAETTFLFSYIPIYIGLLAAQGKILSSSLYNGFLVFLANGLGIFSDKIFYPLTQSVFLLTLVTGIDQSSPFKSISLFFQKSFRTILLVFSFIYSGLLLLKTNLANSGDALAIKGVKLFVGSSVPIIGSTLSDSCSSLISSLSLMHKSLGFFGILTICFLFLPSFVDLFLWKLSLNFCKSIADVLSDQSSKNLFEQLEITISFLMTLQFFMFFVFCISSGILLQFQK